MWDAYMCGKIEELAQDKCLGEEKKKEKGV